MKKLEEIDFSDAKLDIYLNKIRFKGRWYYLPPRVAIVITPINFWSASKAREKKDDYYFAAKKTAIDFACDITSDAGTISLSFARLSPYPEAQKMLWHYLMGTEEEIEVNTELIMTEDRKLRKTVFTAIRSDINNKRSSGTVNISQSAEKRESKKWLWALGAINVKWQRNGNTIQLWIKDTYKWHGNDPKRNIQCVHQAMERADDYGARLFNYTGTKWTIQMIDLQTIDLIPFDSSTLKLTAPPVKSSK